MRLSVASAQVRGEAVESQFTVKARVYVQLYLFSACGAIGNIYYLLAYGAVK